MNIYMNELYGIGIRDTLHGALVHFGFLNDHPHMVESSHLYRTQM